MRGVFVRSKSSRGVLPLFCNLEAKVRQREKVSMWTKNSQRVGDLEKRGMMKKCFG